MTSIGWYPKTIYQWRYEPEQKKLYQSGDRRSKYWQERWLAPPLSQEHKDKVANAEANPKSDYWKAFGGRISSSKGEFPVVFARHEFRERGYTVWGSEPRLVNPRDGAPEGYILLSFSGYRKNNAPCYAQMATLFGEQSLVSLNQEADALKIKLKHSRGGGDPDLFAFDSKRSRDRFFVEVKDEGDALFEAQRQCFGLIEKHLGCEVRLCYVAPTSKEPLYRLG